MIEEAYCSFEISKLLKEKGFDEICTSVYSKITKKAETPGISEWAQLNQIKRPSHQMAMAWLREDHNLWIDIEPLTNYKWTWGIWLMNDPKFKMGESSQVISTYKEAVDAALKYSLENVI